MWIISWIIKTGFLKKLKQSFPSFIHVQISSLSEGPGLFNAPADNPYSKFIPVFPAVLSLFQLCRASHTPLIFFASSASVWAWCKPSHLISFDLHPCDPCRNCSLEGPCKAWSSPLPSDPAPLLHPERICWASPLSPSTLDPRAKIYWRASAVKSGEYIFILIEIKLRLELHFWGINVGCRIDD